MRYPSFLKERDTIGFVAPSFGCSIEPYKSAFGSALKKFKELGHGIELGPNVYADSGTGISASPESCGRELTEGYLSDQSRALLSCGGGELMCEILDHVDFEKIKEAAPKWYMGYSDNTNFTFLLNTLCDTASIYGSCAPSFGMEPWHQAIRDDYALLRGEKLTFEGYPLYEKESLKDEEHPLAPWNVTEPRRIRTYLPALENGGRLAAERSKAGETAGKSEDALKGRLPAASSGQVLELQEDRAVEFSGRLIGGCMDCLVNLLGTRYDKVRDLNARYREDGIIWFLESCDLNVFAIRRAVWQMEHAGWFEHVRGFLIGRPYCNGQVIMDLDQYRAVTEPLAKYGVPVIMDIDIGHIPPTIPVISGAMAEVKVQGQDFSIAYELR